MWLFFYTLSLAAAQLAEVEPSSPHKLLKFVGKVLAGYQKDKNIWQKDSYSKKSIARVKRGKLPIKRLFKKELLNSHPYLAAYHNLDQIAGSYSIDPTGPENFSRFLELHQLCIGTTVEYDMIDRLIYAMIAGHYSPREIYQLKLYQNRLGHIYPDQFKIPLNKNELALEILAEAAKQHKSDVELEIQFDAKDFSFPVDQIHLASYAQCMLALGRSDLAREATERLLRHWYSRYYLREYPSLLELYDKVPRPIDTIPAVPEKYQFSRIVGGTFGTGRWEGNKRIYLTHLKSIFEPSGNRYASRESSVPVDIADFLASVVVSSPVISFIPEFSREHGFFVIFYPQEGAPIAMVGDSGANYDFSEYYAVVDGKFRLVNNSQAHSAMLLFLRETKILNANHPGDVGYPDGQNPVDEILRLGKVSEIPESDFSVPDEISKKGKLELVSKSSIWLPDRNIVLQIAQLSWKCGGKSYQDSEYSLNFNFYSDQTKKDGESRLLKLNKDASEVILELERFTGEKMKSCNISEFSSRMESYAYGPEIQLLKSWGLRNGLPSYSSISELLRLYSILNLKFNEFDTLELPYSFNGHFGETYVSGYWFESEQLLIVADFSFKLSSLPGKIITQALKTKVKDVTMSVKNSNPFVYSNYGITFVSSLPDKGSKPVSFEKFYLKGRLNEGSRRIMYFFSQRKNQAAVFKALPEPDSKF